MENKFLGLLSRNFRCVDSFSSVVTTYQPSVMNFTLEFEYNDLLMRVPSDRKPVIDKTSNFTSSINGICLFEYV